VSESGVLTARAARICARLLHQLGEQDRLVAGGAGDRDPEPTDEAATALAALLVEEPLAAAGAFVEDEFVETVRATWHRRERGLSTTSPEGGLPAGRVAVQAGATAGLVPVAAELADA
jgi:hypothetical protein